jgi:(p)ppGpp synthase/HD superfamily hydrolase
MPRTLNVRGIFMLPFATLERTQMPNLFDAIEFSARAHRGQFRKASQIPYILHPINVARILIECDASQELILAAILHDVVEDTPVTLEQVRAEFGDDVASLVEATSEADKKDTWENRKRAMLDLAETASQDVLLLELADRLDNIREIQRDLSRDGDAVWKRFTRGADQQKWLYLAFADLFSRRLTTECGIELSQEFRTRVNDVFGSQ